jgi:hypothetical protein
MVRGRQGSDGAPFNLGEMTVTRCLRLKVIGQWARLLLVVFRGLMTNCRRAFLRLLMLAGLIKWLRVNAMP